MNLEDFTRLKRVVEDEQSKIDRSKGKLEQILAELKKETDKNSIEGAEKFLLKWEKEIDGEEEEYNGAVEEFKTRWEGKLEQY